MQLEFSLSGTLKTKSLKETLCCFCHKLTPFPSVLMKCLTCFGQNTKEKCSTTSLILALSLQQC